VKWKIAIIGFGNVGQGTLEILNNKKDIFHSRYNFDFDVVAIAGHSKGSVLNNDGINIEETLNLVRKMGTIIEHKDHVDFDSIEIIRNSDANIVVECTPTDIKTGEPGISHIRTALKLNKHVVTTNKGPIALYFDELMQLAKNNNVELKFEGTVLSGTPAINFAINGLAGCNITEIEGILNGTTNFILTKMEQGMKYIEALQEAQRLGYAEADPRADVEGWDAAVKAVILAKVIMGLDISIDDVKTTGITNISEDDIQDAMKKNGHIKLIASVKGPEAIIAPRYISNSHPFANIMYDTNAITFHTDHLGSVTIMGPGAGAIGTGQAVIRDILSIINETRKR